MIGRIKLGGGSSSSGNINGKLATYTVEGGYSVQSGEFVKIMSSTNNTIAPARQKDTILGIARKDANGGSTVKVFVPDV